MVGSKGKALKDFKIQQVHPQSVKVYIFPIIIYFHVRTQVFLKHKIVLLVRLWYVNKEYFLVFCLFKIGIANPSDIF